PWAVSIFPGADVRQPDRSLRLDVDPLEPGADRQYRFDLGGFVDRAGRRLAPRKWLRRGKTPRGGLDACAGRVHHSDDLARIRQLSVSFNLPAGPLPVSDSRRDCHIAGERAGPAAAGSLRSRRHRDCNRAAAHARLVELGWRDYAFLLWIKLFRDR